MPKLSDHFSTEGDPLLRFEAAPAAVQSNMLRVLLPGLERARAMWGGRPLYVTSGYRSPAYNEAVQGSATSDHPAGLAADVKPSLSLLEAYRAYARNPAALGTFDQMIFYPFTTGHIHLGFGPRNRRAVFVALAEPGKYGPLSVWLSESGSAPVLLLAGLALLLLWVLR